MKKEKDKRRVNDDKKWIFMDALDNY